MSDVDAWTGKILLRGALITREQPILWVFQGVGGAWEMRSKSGRKVHAGRLIWNSSS